MARDIKQLIRKAKAEMLPVAIKVPAAVTVERAADSTSPVVIEAPAQSPEVEWFISFNPRDLEDYRYAVRQLKAAFLLHHNPDTLRRLLQEETPLTRRDLQEARNDRLLAAYFRSGRSIRRFAAVIADKEQDAGARVSLWSNWQHQQRFAG
jgi:hypothetical protein